jgi:hypothetical protein
LSEKNLWEVFYLREKRMTDKYFGRNIVLDVDKKEVSIEEYKDFSSDRYHIHISLGMAEDIYKFLKLWFKENNENN